MDSFFNEKWNKGDEAREVTNPYTGEVLDTIPRVNPAVLNRALTTLKEGSAKLRKMGRPELQEIFQRFHKILTDRKFEIAELITREQGKTLREAHIEVQSGIESAEILAINASLVGARILPLATEAGSNNRQGFTVRQPHGVVAIVTPNPQPLILPLINTLYALAVGNAVALKPSQHTSLVALRMVEMLLEAGIPPDAIACFTGSGKTIGSALCQHQLIDHIICSGSLDTIRAVRSKMSFVTSQFQYGCVSTCIVGRSAEIELVADEIIRTAFETSGQAAFTPTWIACFDKKYDDLRDLLTRKISDLKVGDPFEKSTDMGPITEGKKIRRIENRLAYEKSFGAELVTGGREQERVFRPMLLAECDLGKTRFSHREIPAPMIGLTRISKAREATSTLLDQRHHVLTLFSNDEDWATREAMRMPFNNVHVNGIPTWRDGLICIPGHPVRTGRRTALDRINDMSRIRDIVFCGLG